MIDKLMILSISLLMLPLLNGEVTNKKEMKLSAAAPPAVCQSLNADMSAGSCLPYPMAGCVNMGSDGTISFGVSPTIPPRPTQFQ